MPPKSFRPPTTRLVRVDARSRLVGHLVFTASLFLPGMALARSANYVDARGLFAWMLIASVCGYLACRGDKRKAQSGRWRTPEATLHTVELLGGWPCSYAAQNRFHHKTAKTRYQVVFWIIVIAYQLVGLDFLQDWHFSRGAMRALAEL